MSTAPALPVAVLVSGSGTNLQSLIDSAESRGFEIRGVFSDQEKAFGLERARRAGIDTYFIDPADYEDREAFDEALAEAVDGCSPELVLLAGFMRILGPPFVRRFEDRTLNIHPSLLPKYRGLHTHRRAIAAGETLHGCSIHFVNDELDGGPLVAQAQAGIEPGDDEKALSARVQAREHRLYPLVAGWCAAGRLRCREGIAWLDDEPLREPVVFGLDEEIE